MASTSNLPLTGGIPAVLTNAKIYRDGIDLLGVASVELPDFEYLTESLTGLGISGEMDIPVAGQFKALPLKIKWNVPTASATSLLEAVGHYLEARGSLQQLDPGTGTFVQKAFKLVSKAMLELYYLKLSIDGTELVEIGKFDFICRINGVDVLADVRNNLGM